MQYLSCNASFCVEITHPVLEDLIPRTSESDSWGYIVVKMETGLKGFQSVSPRNWTDGAQYNEAGLMASVTTCNHSSSARNTTISKVSNICLYISI